MNIHVNDSVLQDRLAQLVILQKKSLKETVLDVSKRFIKQVVRNTPPMVATQSPASARRAWEQKITEDYTSTPFCKGKWHSKAAIQRIIRAKKQALGRMASGWLKAGNALHATVPAWVRKHGEGEGDFRVMTSSHHCVITIRNRIPYGQSLLLIRSRFSLRKVQQGIEGNLRAMKKKLLCSVKRKS